MKLPPILIIVGPTASGKSGLAIRLSKKLKGEVVSADSRQVYKGLNLGTGKVTKKEMAGVPHYLLDVKDPKKSFSVSEYVKLAQKEIEQIHKRGKLPIIVGGTGFYIDAVLGKVSLPEVAPDKVLRKKLEKKSLKELLVMLRKLDAEKAKTIDSNNRVRLVRAIEIAKALGKVPKIEEVKKYSQFWIGLNPSKENLQENINKRLRERLKKGMVREVEKLNKNRLSWKRMEELGLEYRYISRYLRGVLSKEEMEKQLEKEIWRYVKQQMTWFKRNKKIKWFDPEKKGFGDILKTIKHDLGNGKRA